MAIRSVCLNAVVGLLILGTCRGANAQRLPIATPEEQLTAITPGQTRPFTESMVSMVARDKAIKEWYRQRGLKKVRIKMPNPKKMHKPEDRTDTYFGEFTPPSFMGMTPRTPKQKPGAQSNSASPGGGIVPTLNAAFPGISFTGWIPPDTNGAVGPNHFAVIVNGGFGVFSRTGTALVQIDLETFFTFSSGGTNYPRNGAFDPRIVYDSRSKRWFATALEFSNQDANHIVLAVSKTTDPTGVWDKYAIEIGTPGEFTDYESLAVDDNGVYFGWTKYGNGDSGLGGTSKASLIAANPSLSTVYSFNNLPNTYATPQPAHNYGAVAPTDSQWFVLPASSFTSVVLWKWTWNGANPPTISSFLFNTPLADMPAVFIPSGTDPSLPLETGDFRMQMSVNRNKRVWATRGIGMNASGTSNTVDRAGAEWFEFNVSNENAPTLVQNGRVWDPASTPRHYVYPSLVINGQGHVTMGFSGASINDFIGIYTTRRLATDPINTMGTITQVVQGLSSYTVDFGSGRN